MSDQIQIPARLLGELALPSFCQRCFWIKLKVGNKLPFQIFPGIFSSIDSYSKRAVHSWFDNKGEAPPWLSELGPIKSYVNPPHYSAFYIIDKESGIKLTGSPDAIFVRDDNSHLIADYKTSRYTATQDKLFPFYEVQLNVYALIGEHQGLSPVSGLALIYTEPVTGDSEALHDDIHRESGFAIGFKAHILHVEKNLSIIRPLLAKVREIYKQEEIPPRTDDCKDCGLLEGLVNIVT